MLQHGRLHTTTCTSVAASELQGNDPIDEVSGCATLKLFPSRWFTVRVMKLWIILSGCAISSLSNSFLVGGSYEGNEALDHSLRCASAGCICSLSNSFLEGGSCEGNEALDHSRHHCQKEPLLHHLIDLVQAAVTVQKHLSGL